MCGTLPASTLFPADNPAAIAHINLLQSIIARLANQSSACKTWCLTLISALIAFAGATKVPAILAFTLLPIVVFGFLDTMYLAQEKAYRDKYEALAASLRDGSYKRDDVFDARAARGRSHIGRALKSWSVAPVYGGLLLAYLLVHVAVWHLLLVPASG
jgi:hypothetical protein